MSWGVRLLLLLFVCSGIMAAQTGTVPSHAASQPAKSQPVSEQAKPDDPTAEITSDLPPLPSGHITLVGGTVDHVDQVRDRLSIRPYGGKKMEVYFDERTHIYRNGAPTTQLGIHKGDRVYVDTQLVSSKVFARNIRVETNAVSADARGQVLKYDVRSGQMTLMDTLSSQPVTFRVSPSTVVRNEKGTAGSEVRPGSLVAVKFSPGQGRGVAQEISVIAAPGNSFTFYGRVSYLDMRGTLAVVNQSDEKTYDINFNPARVNRDQLREGVQVLVHAKFNGSGYDATDLTVMPSSAAAKPAEQ